MAPAFVSYEKIPRAPKVGVWITEKIDGTNGQIVIDGPAIWAGSRNRWIQANNGPTADNFGFAAWVAENAPRLMRLGNGRHFGEWYGAGIGRRYDMTERRFALFDRGTWSPEELQVRGLDEVGVQCVPILATCGIDTLNSTVAFALENLEREGSVLVPGWMKPEGVVVQIQDGPRFKITDNGNRPKFEATNAVPEQASQLRPDSAA